MEMILTTIRNVCIQCRILYLRFRNHEKGFNLKLSRGGGGTLKRYNLGATTCLNWDPPAALAPDRMSPDPTKWEGRRALRPVSIFTQEVDLFYGQDSIPGSVAQSLY